MNLTLHAPFSQPAKFSQQENERRQTARAGLGLSYLTVEPGPGNYERFAAIFERTMRSRATWIVGLLLIFAGTMQSRAQLAATPPHPAISLDQLYDGFVGDWVGQLEYRDFSNNSRVFLPTWLRVTRSSDGRSLQFAYIYDDGPNKTVKELSVVSIDTAASTVTFTSDRDHSSDTYKVAGLADFAAKGRGTLALTGTGMENDKKVDVRITIKLGRNLYTYQKETKLPGAEFLFRDGYTFTRKDPPP